MSETSYEYADVLAAVHAFLKAYLTPAVADGCIIWGNQNNITLPAENNDYVLFYVNGMERHGTTVETYDGMGETLTLKESSEITVRVDCYADSSNGEDGTNAQIRAYNLELLARSSVAPKFFKSYGLSLLYADPAVDTTVLQDDSGEYLHRWMVVLHLHTTNTLTISQEGFNAVKLKAVNSIISPDKASIETSGVHVANVDVKIKATD